MEAEPSFEVTLNMKSFPSRNITVQCRDGNKIILRAKHNGCRDEHGYVSRELYSEYELPDGISAKTIEAEFQNEKILIIKARYVKQNLSEKIQGIDIRDTIEYMDEDIGLKALERRTRIQDRLYKHACERNLRNRDFVDASKIILGEKKNSMKAINIVKEREMEHSLPSSSEEEKNKEGVVRSLPLSESACSSKFRYSGVDQQRSASSVESLPKSNEGIQSMDSTDATQIPELTNVMTTTRSTESRVEVEKITECRKPSSSEREGMESRLVKMVQFEEKKSDEGIQIMDSTDATMIPEPTNVMTISRTTVCTEGRAEGERITKSRKPSSSEREGMEARLAKMVQFEKEKSDEGIQSMDSTDATKIPERTNVMTASRTTESTEGRVEGEKITESRKQSPAKMEGMEARLARMAQLKKKNPDDVARN